MPTIKITWPERAGTGMIEITHDEMDYVKRKKDFLDLTWREYVLFTSTTLYPNEAITKKNGWTRLADEDDWDSLKDIVGMIEGAIAEGVVDLYLFKDERRKRNRLTLWMKKGEVVT